MSNSTAPNTPGENLIHKALPKVAPTVFGILLGWVGHQDHDALFVAGATLFVAAVTVLVVGRYWKKDDPNALLDISAPRVSVVPDSLRSTAKWLLLIVPVVVAVVCIFFWGVLFSLASIGKEEPASRPLVYAALPDDQTLELSNVIKFTLSKRSNVEQVRVKEVRLIVTPQPAKSVRMIVASLPDNVVIPNEFRARLGPSGRVVVADMYDGDKPAPPGSRTRQRNARPLRSSPDVWRTSRTRSRRSRDSRRSATTSTTRGNRCIGRKARAQITPIASRGT
jgi:hypothetical protein